MSISLRKRAPKVLVDSIEPHDAIDLNCAQIVSRMEAMLPSLIVAQKSHRRMDFMRFLGAKEEEDSKQNQPNGAASNQQDCKPCERCFGVYKS